MLRLLLVVLVLREDPMMKRTRVTVKVLEGKNLLVSDRLTGTSDPLAVLWIGSSEEGDVDFKYDKRVQVTCYVEHCASLPTCRTGPCTSENVRPVWDDTAMPEAVVRLKLPLLSSAGRGKIRVPTRLT